MNRLSFWSGGLVGALIGGLLGYALGGFTAVVLLVALGAVWWAVAMYAAVALVGCLALRWLWTRRPARD